jgi:hypothetical protein
MGSEGYGAMKAPEKPVGELTNDAKASLMDLLAQKNLALDQWYLRLASGGSATGWEPLPKEPVSSQEKIKERIAFEKKPVRDLVLAFVGTVDHRGRKSLMAQMQYFRTGYETGLLFGSHLAADSGSKKLRASGAFLIFGACKNMWI